MKKRVISLVLVLTLIFTGAFSCIASADSDIVRKYFDLYKKYIQANDEFTWDVFGFGYIEDIIDLIGEQQDSVQEQQDDSDGLKLYYACEQKYFPIDVLGYSSSNNTLKDCAYFCILENFRSESYSSRYNLGNADCIAVPNEYAQYVSSSFDGYYYRLIASGPIVYYEYTLKLQVANDGTPITYAYSGPTSHNVSSGQFYLNNITVNPDPFYYGKRLGINDFERARLLFSGTSSETPGTINLFLNASRDIVSDVDGTFMIGFGILYDDGSDRMYCGEYIDFREVGSGSSWESSFDLKAFSEYAYRKRCPLENYKAFIFAYQNGFVFNMEFPLELDPPGGIFDDVEDFPDWKDYEPEPSEPPEPPSLDTDIFNFTFNTNNYVNYTFQTINNFSYSGGGGGGSGGGGGGGTGNDDSSVPDDSSSGGDSSGGDSSVDDSGSGGGVNINPEIDFDFGLLTAFLNWFTDAFFTLIGNISGALGALLTNFNLFVSDLFDFFNDIKLYFTGFLKSSLEYLSQLILNFNTDFNRRINAFSKYIGACIDVTDFNIQIVVSNLKQYFENQFIPDSDNVNFILSDCLGWYYQIQELLSSKSYSAQAFTLYLAPFDYTFTFDDVEVASQLKTICTVIILGFTALKCVRIGFQTFGINIGGGESDDS